MSRREHPRQIEIDPFFDAPSGLRGVRYAEETSANVEYIGYGTAEEYYGNLDDYYLENYLDDDGDMEGGLPVPEVLEILSQTVRKGSGGATTVDVIFFTPDLPGVSDFDVRIDKV